ncbi:MAG: hypothetical protein ACLUNO_11080 [Oscillospiraceae bacterium]
MTGYDAAGYAAIAAALNANFAAFPADITVYGLTADALADLDLRRGPEACRSRCGCGFRDLCAARV